MQKRWNELSPLMRIAIVKITVLDAGLRCWALADLAHRPQNQVTGSKTAWAIGLAFVNSVGALPATYLLWARRRAPSS
jgi:hypothetical protein